MRLARIIRLRARKNPFNATTIFARRSEFVIEYLTSASLLSFSLSLFLHLVPSACAVVAN